MVQTPRTSIRKITYPFCDFEPIVKTDKNLIFGFKFSSEGLDLFCTRIYDIEKKIIFLGNFVMLKLFDQVRAGIEKPSAVSNAVITNRISRLNVSSLKNISPDEAFIVSIQHLQADPLEGRL